MAVFVTVVLVASGATALATSPAAASAVATSPFDLAHAEAAASGEPVIVDEETTETTTVTAQPEGGFVMSSSLTPERVKIDGEWQPIDTRLHVLSDGSLAPVASLADVSFSGGGTGPAVVLRDGDQSVAVSWPQPLPVPTFDGPSATYRSVLPGVDLVLTAHAESFSEVLVVHDANAAENPALQELQLGVRADGVALSEAPTGGLIARDDSGEEVFGGSPPVMWDSTVDSAGVRPTAERLPAEGVSTIPLSLPPTDGTDGDGTATSVMTLSPPAADLSGPDVTYPVFIDPSMTPGRAHYAVVFSKGWHYSDDQNDGDDLKVGDCDWDYCNNIGVGRTYLAFNTDPLTDKPTKAKVSAAKVKVYETQSSHACTAEPVDLYVAGAISKSTVWPGPLKGFLQSTSSNAGTSCGNPPGGYVTFSNGNVVDQFQAAADQGADTQMFGLRAHDEGDKYQWKRFDESTSGSSVATIEVTFDFPPSTPTSLKLDNAVTCNGTTFTSDNTPTVHARAVENNTPTQPIRLFFQLQDTAGGNKRSNPTGVQVASNADAPWTTNSQNTSNANAVPDGTYGFRAQASTLSGTDSPFSGWLYFTIDHTAPTQPTVSSIDYPTGTWGARSGGSITVDSSSDAAAFTYAFDTGTPPTVSTATPCSFSGTGLTPASSAGTASITVPTAMTPGYHVLTVKAWDDARNGSTAKTYSFYVAPSIGSSAPPRPEAENLAIDPASPACAGPSGCVTYRESISTLSGGMGMKIIAPDTTATSPSLFATQSFNVDTRGEYAISARLVTIYHFGIVQFKIDGQTLRRNGQPISIDTYSAALGYFDAALGGLHLEPGAHTITYVVVGKNAASTDYVYNGDFGNPTVHLTQFHDGGYSALIDLIRFVPVSSPSYTSLAGAYNNDGIASTGTAADIGPSVSKAGISRQALIDKGLNPGADYTVAAGTASQVTFHLGGTDGLDNVIAMGQTIDLPADVSADYVDLLVASTCQASPRNDAVQVTMNFTDLSTTSQALQAVPRWDSAQMPAPDDLIDTKLTLVTTMDNSLQGSASTTTLKPTLYRLSIATHSNAALHSVTLPYLGSDLTSGCSNTANLHVFAISTHNGAA